MSGKTRKRQFPTTFPHVFLHILLLRQILRATSAAMALPQCTRYRPPK